MADFHSAHLDSVSSHTIWVDLKLLHLLMFIRDGVHSDFSLHTAVYMVQHLTEYLGFTMKMVIQKLVMYFVTIQSLKEDLCLTSGHRQTRHTMLVFL